MKDGKFYESFKEKVEGSVEFTKDGKTYYHVIHDKLEGKLHSIQVYEGDYGTDLKVSLTDKSGDAQVLRIPFLSGTEVNDYAQGFSYYIDQLAIGDELELGLNQTEKNKKGYLYRNFFVKKNGTSLKYSYSPKECPSGVQIDVTNPTTKKTEKKWDFTAKNAFLYDKIAPVVEKLTPAQAAAPAAGYSDEPDGLDLPF